MAKTPATPEETPAADAAPKPAKGSMLGKILVLGLVVLVVAVECLVAYLCIPSASDAASSASNAVKPPADRKKGETESPGEGGGPASVEVDLKEFSVTIYQPASNSTLQINLHLHGIVAVADKKEFDRLFELNQNRFREQVMVVIRSAEMADLADPSLGLIKRTILDKARNIFGQQLLQELVVSDYSSLEN
jgi:flagellar FliL protein